MSPASFAAVFNSSNACQVADEVVEPLFSIWLHSIHRNSPRASPSRSMTRPKTLEMLATPFQLSHRVAIAASIGVVVRVDGLLPLLFTPLKTNRPLSLTLTVEIWLYTLP